MSLSSKVILQYETTESLENYEITNCQMKFKAVEEQGLLHETDFLSEMSDSNSEDMEYDNDKMQSFEDEREANHE